MKTSLRNIALSALITIGGFTAITYTSCTKDECKDVVCQNGGTCVSGNCSCPSGYEGSNCQTLWTSKFVKTWTASADRNVSSGTTLNPYSCIIAQGASLNNVVIGTGFYDNFFNHSINATVSGSGTNSTITIPIQTPDGPANSSVQGSATYNSDGTLSWTYTIINPTLGTKNYSGTWN